MLMLQAVEREKRALLEDIQLAHEKATNATSEQPAKTKC